VREEDERVLLELHRKDMETLRKGFREWEGEESDHGTDITGMELGMDGLDVSADPGDGL